MQEWAHDHCRLEQCVKAGNEAEAMSQKGLASAEIKGENGEFQKERGSAGASAVQPTVSVLCGWLVSNFQPR